MTEDTRNPDAIVYAAASAIGIIAGIRAMAPLAIVSYMASSGCLQEEKSRYGLFAHKSAMKFLSSMAGGEAFFDKLPFMPKRTDTFGLTARILSGAICGATICAAKKRSALLGGIAGTFGAIGATFAVVEVRRSLTQDLHVPDTAIGLVEDAITLWGGKVLCQRLSPKQLEPATTN